MAAPKIDTRDEYKAKELLKGGRRSAFRRYRDICYGNTSLWYVVKSELIVTLTAGISGALGLFLRQLLYPSLFQHVGRKVVFGKNITLRHAHKISLGNNVVLDDNCVVDAKGGSNQGIILEDDVYIGRNTIIYCKDGDIHIKRCVNISSNCQIFSSNKITIEPQTVIAAFTYILSGGHYDYTDRTKAFAEQSGMLTRGPTTIGPNCWLAAGVIVVDGTTIGEHCVIGAGSVVTGDIPAHSLASGIPAKVVRHIDPTAAPNAAALANRRPRTRAISYLLASMTIFSSLIFGTAYVDQTFA
jgi:acetyltransferase-like isoleucine patch superfamily enzyme